MMTPQEVASHSFAKATLGGYNLAQVDEFLDALTEDYAALYNENAILKNKLKVLSDTVEEYRATDNAMRKTLLAAQKMADDMVADAKKKQAELVGEAEQDAHKRVEELQKAVKAEEYRRLINVKTATMEQPVGSLSGGNQQKVVLAKWMLTQPDVLILDEPTRGIDVGAKYEIYSVINDLAKSGKAIIIISSEMPEIIGTCDRTYVINEGAIAGELVGSAMTQEAIMGCIMAHNRKGE